MAYSLIVYCEERCLGLQPEAAPEGRRDEEQPEQEAPGAPQRRARHPRQPPPLRAERPLQAGPPLHPQALRQLPPHQELLPR